MRNFRCIGPIIWSCLIFASTGCKKDHVLTGSVDSDFAILISYEEETRSSFSTLSPAASGKSDEATFGQEVNGYRQKIKIGIAEDGSSVIEMIRMEPKYSRVSAGKIPPTRADEVHSMVFQNGQVTMYNAKGLLIGQERTELPSYKSLISQVRQNKNCLTRAIYSNFLMQQKLKSSESSDLKIKDEGDLTITEKIVGPEDGLDPAMNGYKISNYVETTTGLLLGTAIEDASGSTVFRTVMTYNADENNPLPEFSHEESFATSENGEEYMITTLRYTENVEIVIE
jgi:hypothetical protein